jgi:hypothetical protein
MIRFVAIIVISANLSWLALGYSMLQAQQIVHVQQDLCIVPGSAVHAVYQSMLATLRREVAEWNEFQSWSNDDMAIISPSIDIYRLESQANLRDLEGASICTSAS